MNIPRRTFLKSTLMVTSSLVLGIPQAVMSAWPKPAFDAKNLEGVIKALFNTAQTMESDKVKITTPEIAENGALVPVEVSVNFPKIESITIIAEKNRVPLIGQFNFSDSDQVEYWVKTRIKMAETSKVIVIVNAEGKLYKAHKEVKVTVGGCGG